jgi:hypothetical protein
MEQSQPNLEQVVDALFDGKTTTFTTSAGVEVRFELANLKRLGKATSLVNLIMERADKDKIAKFIGSVATEQSALMADGKSPYALDLNAALLLEKAYTNHSLLLQIFGLIAEELPGFVATFTNMSEADFDALVLDEQLVVAAGVLAVNYGFFTQSLPRIIASAMRGFASKKSGAGAKQAVVTAAK